MKKGTAIQPKSITVAKPLSHHDVVVRGGKMSRSKMSKEDATKISRKANKIRWAKYRALKRAERKAQKEAAKKNES